MLYYWFYVLNPGSLTNVFKYITFRTFAACVTSIGLSMCVGPAFIRMLERKQISQSIRNDGPQSHLKKGGTPTMGGGLILLAIVVPTLLWADLSHQSVWLALTVTLLFGVIGYVDDYRKVMLRNHRGLSGRQKLVAQILIAFVASCVLMRFPETDPVLKFPFFKGSVLMLGPFYVLFSTLVIVGTSNAVNLTDGLDGLAVGPTITTASTLLVLAYCAGHLKIAEYLQIPYVAGAGELAIFCSTVASACLGFLWFNTYPAQVFMGDVGALALGAALAIVAIITKNEILLVLCGGIFVIEALSVMAQVASFKMTGRRVFRMAPIHHHFELKGWAEPKVIVRFWIISIVLAVASLATLKLR